MTQVKRAGEELTIDKTVKMLHVVLQMGHDREPMGVSITNNPLEFGSNVMAQIVMHKTRSHGCAVQVARYVRRTFELENAVTTHRSTRVIEAKIAHVCMGGYQYGPENISERYVDCAKHIAATSISRLLEEVKDGHNAARIRYVVYEVRAMRQGQPVRIRGITHKMHRVEELYRRTPPDTLTNIDLVHVGKFESIQLAEAAAGSFERASDHLWTRFPPIEYLKRVFKFDANDELVYTADSTGAVRPYDTPSVVLGASMVYSERQIRLAMKHGAWIDTRLTKNLDKRLS